MENNLSSLHHTKSIQMTIIVDPRDVKDTNLQSISCDFKKGPFSVLVAKLMNDNEDTILNETMGKGVRCVSAMHWTKKTTLRLIEWCLMPFLTVFQLHSGDQCTLSMLNPVAMTIINPRKEFWSSRGSNQRPTVLKFATLPT